MINLLIIDDDSVDLEQAARVARETSLALRITTASDAVEGLTRARTTAPDVILLDMNLAPNGGEELPVQLRDAGIDAAIILLTATTDPERVAACVTTAGAVKYLPKSRLDPERLESAIRSAVRVTKPIDARFRRIRISRAAHANSSNS